MKAYFGYLGRHLVRSVGIWVVAGIYWLYTALLLLIIPGIVQSNPLSIYANEYVSVTVVYVILLSIFSALVVAHLFRSDLECGNELVVLSKPIKRWKIMVCKFGWVLLAIAILAMGSTILCLFTMCFGHYSGSHINGMKFAKVPALIGATWLALLVICLFFCSIGILISNFTSRIHIIISLVIPSVFFTAYSYVIKGISPNLAEEAKDFGGYFYSYSLNNGEGEGTSIVYSVNYNVVQNNDTYAIYHDVRKSNAYIAQYFDLARQFSNLYNAFDLNDSYETQLENAWGHNVYYETKMKPEDNALNELIKYFSQTKYQDYQNFDGLPLVMPCHKIILSDNCSQSFTNEQLLTNDGQTSGIYFYGISKESYPFAAAANIDNNTIYMSNRYLTLDGLFPNTSISPNNLNIQNKTIADQFNTDIFDELFIPLLLDEKPETTSVSQNWWLPFNASKDANSRTTLDLWLNQVYWFLNQHSKEYQIPLDTEQEINDAIAKVNYSLLKDFIWVYWTQIVPSYLNTNSITWDDFLQNGVTSSSLDANNITWFNQILTDNIQNSVIYDPQGNYINFPNSFSVANFLERYRTYCPSTQFHDGNWMTRWTHLDRSESQYNNTCGYIVYDPIQKTIGYDWDHYGLGKSNYYDAFVGRQVYTNYPMTELQWWSQLSRIYIYQCTLYVDNTTTSAIWVTVSLLLWGISILLYRHIDVK